MYQQAPATIPMSLAVPAGARNSTRQLQTEKASPTCNLASGRNRRNPRRSAANWSRYPSDADVTLCLGAAQRAAGPPARGGARKPAGGSAGRTIPLGHPRSARRSCFEQGRADEAIQGVHRSDAWSPSVRARTREPVALTSSWGDNRLPRRRIARPWPSSRRLPRLLTSARCTTSTGISSRTVGDHSRRDPADRLRPDHLGQPRRRVPAARPARQALAATGARSKPRRATSRSSRTTRPRFPSSAITKAG